MITFLKRLKAGLDDWLAVEPYTEIADELELEIERRRGVVG